jgi:ADP-ribose pyrophosphatase
MTGFRVVDTTTRARSSFLELVEATVESDDGTRFLRTIVRHPGAVTVVPVTDDGAHVLLVRQFRAAAGRELLEAPAGKRDVEGEAPELTGRRELEEEVAHRAGRMVWLAEAYTSPGFSDEYAYIYAALDLSPLPNPHAATAEEAAMSVERVALADTDVLVAEREIVDATTIIALLLTQRMLQRSA